MTVTGAAGLCSLGQLNMSGAAATSGRLYLQLQKYTLENEAQKEAWGRFGKHPEWQRLRGMAEYADGTILRNIVNLSLKPAEYSQI